MSNPLNNFTAEQLREIAEAGNEWWQSFVPILTSDVQGHIICPRCSADASWKRDGRRWSVHCERCSWDAAGMLSATNVMN